MSADSGYFNVPNTAKGRAVFYTRGAFIELMRKFRTDECAKMDLYLFTYDELIQY